MSIQSLDRVMGLRNGQVIASRLRWLEERLRWHGSFRRGDLVQRFGISPQQASADIATFQEVSGEAAALDQSTKVYVPSGAGKTEVFPGKDAIRWLREEASHAPAGSLLPVQDIPLPVRRGNDKVLAALIASFENRVALEVTYQSLNGPDPSRRTICTHVLVDTGDRLHARAWDEKRSRFVDFVVARILKACPASEYPWVDGRADVLWHEMVEVVLEPADGLSPAQRSVVEREFGMTDGRVAIPTRKALATYVLDRLGLVLRGEGTLPKHLVQCANLSELHGFIPYARDSLI